MGRRNIFELRCTATIAALLFATTAATAGCGRKDSLRRYPVRGTVTYMGKPVPSGEVTFEPNGRAGNKGPASRGDIENGVYSIGRAKGHIGGAYIIRVNGYGLETTQTPDGPAPVTLFSAHVQSCELPQGEATHDIDVVLPDVKRR